MATQKVQPESTKRTPWSPEQILSFLCSASAVTLQQHSSSYTAHAQYSIISMVSEPASQPSIE